MYRRRRARGSSSSQEAETDLDAIPVPTINPHDTLNELQFLQLLRRLADGDTFAAANSVARANAIAETEAQNEPGRAEKRRRIGAAAAEEVDEESQKVIAATAKACPGCKVKIQKNGGCEHMSCKPPFPEFDV